MSNNAFATLQTAFLDLGAATLDYLLIALAAFTIAKVTEWAGKVCPDSWLWGAFRFAGLSLAGIDLLVHVAQHGAHAVGRMSQLIS